MYLILSCIHIRTCILAMFLKVNALVYYFYQYFLNLFFFLFIKIINEIVKHFDFVLVKNLRRSIKGLNFDKMS